MRKTHWLLAGLMAVPFVVRADTTMDRGRFLDHDTVRAMGGVGNYLTQSELDAYWNKGSEAGTVASNKIPEAVVYFDRGQDSLNKNGVNAVDKVATELKGNSALIVQVDAYTDSRGDTDLNKKLSKDRALSVKNELVTQGVNSSQIQTRGLGADQPIASNESEGGRAVNRRAELFVTS